MTARLGRTHVSSLNAHSRGEVAAREGKQAKGGPPTVQSRLQLLSSRPCRGRDAQGQDDEQPCRGHDGRCEDDPSKSHACPHAKEDDAERCFSARGQPLDVKGPADVENPTSDACMHARLLQGPQTPAPAKVMSCMYAAFPGCRGRSPMLQRQQALGWKNAEGPIGRMRILHASKT